MSAATLFAWTATGGHYPEYANLSLRDGKYLLTVRSPVDAAMPGLPGPTAQIALPFEQFQQLTGGAFRLNLAASTDALRASVTRLYAELVAMRDGKIQAELAEPGEPATPIEQELRQAAAMIRTWIPEVYPTATNGQVHFARAVMESVAGVLDRARDALMAKAPEQPVTTGEGAAA